MDEATVVTDASADSSESQPAVVEGATTTADTGSEQSASADSSESQPAVVEGAEVVATEQPVKKTFEERVEELASKKIAEAEARITAKLQTETKAPLDFIPDLDFGKVNEYIKNTLESIEQAQLEGDFVKALDLQEELRQTREAIKGNESRKASHMEQEGHRQQSEQQIQALNSQISAASALVAKEFKIPSEAWKKGEDFFLAERQSKPLVDAQYREKVMLQGPVAAMMWAKEYVEKNMGKKEQDLINSKEAAKATLPQGKTSTGLMTDEKANKLAAAKTAAMSGNPSDLAAYSQALRESRT